MCVGPSVSECLFTRPFYLVNAKGWGVNKIKYLIHPNSKLIKSIEAYLGIIPYLEALHFMRFGSIIIQCVILNSSHL